MADNNNPHSIDPTQVDSTKQISLELLKRYHHNLLSVLRLTNDTGTYKYGGERTDFPQDIESVGAMLDKLYDLAKDGSISFASGKSGDATSVVSFDSEDGEDTNLYWVNAKVGDETINIKLDANSFVKDSVLKSVQLVSVIADGSGNKTYKVDGVAVDEKPEGFPDDKGAGTYFFYTWEINKGEEGKEYDYSVISLKDVYGDLKGDDYITYDKDNSQIKAQTANVQSENRVLKGEVMIYEQNGEYRAESLDDAFEPDTFPDFESAEDYVLYRVGGSELVNEYGDTYEVYLVEYTWCTDSDDTTKLATAENLADVAQNLQDQIDNASARTALIDGVVTYNTTGQASSLKKSETATGSKYTLGVSLASDTEIDNMFAECGIRRRPLR